MVSAGEGFVTSVRVMRTLEIAVFAVTALLMVKLLAFTAVVNPLIGVKLISKEEHTIVLADKLNSAGNLTIILLPVGTNSVFQGVVDVNPGVKLR